MSSSIPIYSESNFTYDENGIRQQLVQTESLSINIDIAVAQNEPMVNHVFNRNAKKLLDNDLALYALYKKIFSQVGIKDWAENATYNNGDYVWFSENSRLYLLKCIVDNNNRRPIVKLNGTEPIESFLKSSGWENKNRYLTIFDYGIESFLKGLVDAEFDAHQSSKEYHPFGEVSLDPNDGAYIGNALLKKDMSNIDSKRQTVFFPQFVQKLDHGVAILNGYMRNYGSLLEYDIVVKLAASEKDNDNQIFSASSSLSANTLKLALFTGLTKNSVSYQENDKYFHSSAAMDIFSPTLDSDQTYSSKIGLLKQANRNDFANTYAAKITFLKPFANRNYMVFSNSILSQTNGTESSDGHMLVVPSQNDIAVCNKTRDSITLLNITFPQSTKFGDTGYNGQNGGLVSNSFHCKVIGTIGA